MMLCRYAIPGATGTTYMPSAAASACTTGCICMLSRPDAQDESKPRCNTPPGFSRTKHGTDWMSYCSICTGSSNPQQFVE